MNYNLKKILFNNGPVVPPLPSLFLVLGPLVEELFYFADSQAYLQIFGALVMYL